MEDRATVLRALAARNAAKARNAVKKWRFKLARDLAAIEKGTGGLLPMVDLRIASDQWFHVSRQFLDAHETADSCLAALVAEIVKVRKPTGEGALELAMAAVSKLSASDLPIITGYTDAPEEWRRLAALHRELSAAKGGGTYFLSYRHAAQAIGVKHHQQAHDITVALERLRVIRIVDKGLAGSNSRKAAEFRYLLQHNGDEADGGGNEPTVEI